MKRKYLPILLSLVLALVLTSGVSAADFVGSVTLPADFSIYVGETTTITGTWATNKDFTRYQWSLDGVAGTIMEIPEAEKLAGSRGYLFTGAATGTFEVCLSVWHHTQTDRTASDCVTITVLAPVQDYPAAPAIANAYLDSIGFTGARGEIIKAVTEEMKPGNDFHGIAIDEPGYKEEVIAFVKGLLPTP